MRRALGIGALCVAAGAAPASAQAQMTTYEQLQVFSGVLSQIRVNYVDSVNYGTLARAAIEGMLGSLDPHSRYVSRPDFELDPACAAGELAGAGIRLAEAAAA